MIKIEKLSDHRPSPSIDYFFDNNIWMLIFCPIGNYNKSKQKAYSGLFSTLLSYKSKIYTSSLVLSEFTNRYLRLDFDIEKMKPANAGLYNKFKPDYVRSPRCKYISQSVVSAVTDILKHSTRSSDDFNSVNLTEILNLSLDIQFNDSYYFHLASKKNWRIVTDDADLADPNLPGNKITLITY